MEYQRRQPARVQRQSGTSGSQLKPFTDNRPEFVAQRKMVGRLGVAQRVCDVPRIPQNGGNCGLFCIRMAIESLPAPRPAHTLYDQAAEGAGSKLGEIFSFTAMRDIVTHLGYRIGIGQFTSTTGLEAEIAGSGALPTLISFSNRYYKVARIITETVAAAANVAAAALPAVPAAALSKVVRVVSNSAITVSGGNPIAADAAAAAAAATTAANDLVADVVAMTGRGVIVTPVQAAVQAIAQAISPNIAGAINAALVPIITAEQALSTTHTQRGHWSVITNCADGILTMVNPNDPGVSQLITTEAMFHANQAMAGGGNPRFDWTESAGGRHRYLGRNFSSMTVNNRYHLAGNAPLTTVTRTLNPFAPMVPAPPQVQAAPIVAGGGVPATPLNPAVSSDMQEFLALSGYIVTISR